MGLVVDQFLNIFGLFQFFEFLVRNFLEFLLGDVGDNGDEVGYVFDTDGDAG